MINKKDTNCCFCGEHLSAGTGIAFFVDEEDEMLGFGPMGRTGWMAKCDDREACKQRQQENKEYKKKEKEKSKNKEKIEEELFRDGIYMKEEEQIVLDGIYFSDINGEGFNIYGGGTEYVDTGSYIWKVENNGSDGDDWSRNNIRTGGAGAIGFRFERTAERLLFLRENCKDITAEEEKEEKQKEEEEERIREGLRKMLERVTWSEIEKAVGNKTFCPRELVINGKPTINLTIEQAKNIWNK